MKSDALFQLGMGPVVLEATQTEDHSSVRSARARNASLRADGADAGRAAARFPALRFIDRLRGNSTKTLILPA